MLRHRKRWLDEEPNINLTPLIDVVFVILIMFIVIAPLLELDQIELADGSSEQVVSATSTSPISIHVFKDNSLKYNQQDVNLDQLLLLLKQAKNQHPEAVPQVFHDQRANFGTYQKIKNATEIAGFHQMDIILKPGS